MTAELAPLLMFSLSSSRGPRAMELRVPQMAGVHPLILEQSARDAPTLAATLPLLALQFVSRVDGEALDLAGADALAADAALMRGLLGRIRTLLETLRERGRVFMLCPGCGAWEAEVGITALALTIASPLPGVFDGPFLALPALSSEGPDASRPDGARAARVRFELPSARLELDAPTSGGVLGCVPLAAGPADASPSRHPSRSGPGWLALRRLALSVEPPLSMEAAGALPAIDFLFLDLLHHIVYRAPVAHDTPGRVRCPRCGREFLCVADS